MKTFFIEVNEEQVDVINAETIREAMESMVKKNGFRNLNYSIDEYGDHEWYVSVHCPYEQITVYEIGEEGY